MSTAAVVIAVLAIGYCVVVAAYCWLKSASDKTSALLHGEDRDTESVGVLSALSSMNPAHRFRRYSDDEQLVTRTFTDSRSALADESR